MIDHTIQDIKIFLLIHGMLFYLMRVQVDSVSCIPFHRFVYYDVL